MTQMTTVKLPKIASMQTHPASVDSPRPPPCAGLRDRLTGQLIVDRVKNTINDDITEVWRLRSDPMSCWHFPLSIGVRARAVRQLALLTRREAEGADAGGFNFRPIHQQRDISAVAPHLGEIPVVG